MWSVWSERVDIYLGLAQSMVRMRGRNTVVIEHSPTWPLERILESVARVWSSPIDGNGVDIRNVRRPFRRRPRLRIALGAGLCQSSAFTVPMGVSRYVEVLNLARASTAQAQKSADVICAVDPMAPGTVASVGTRFFSDLKDWAQSHQATIESLQPLWSVATQCALAGKQSTRGIVLCEPDGITLIAGTQADKRSAAVNPVDILTIRNGNLFDALHGTAHLMDKQVQMKVQRWKIANGLQDDNKLLKMNFIADAQPKVKGLPSYLANHWSCA